MINYIIFQVKYDRINFLIKFYFIYIFIFKNLDDIQLIDITDNYSNLIKVLFKRVNNYLFFLILLLLIS
jgi:hypothetical protein